MNKKCPHCGARLPVESLSSCPNCGLLLLDTQSEPERISREQEEKIVAGVSRNLAENSRFLWRISWRTLVWFFSLLGLAFGWGILSAVQSLNQLAAKRF